MGSLFGYHGYHRCIMGAVFMAAFFIPNLLAQGTTALEGVEVVAMEEEEKVTKPPLTGDPQKDYIHDPNLPHELNGFDLAQYPFYSRVPPPKTFNFTCVGRHDGFYASVPHQCQVYHNCLYEVRYDFLCANYTAFDQKTFICHYASEVDCPKSEKYYFRNDELYETTTTTTQAPQIIYLQGRPPSRPRPQGANIRKFNRPQTQNKRVNTPITTTKAPDYYYDTNNPIVQPSTGVKTPIDEYMYDYDDYDYYGYDYYYDEPTTTTTTQRPRRPFRQRRPGRFGQQGRFRPGRRQGVFNTPGRPRPRINAPVPLNNPGRVSRFQDAEPIQDNLPLGNQPSKVIGPGRRRKKPNQPRLTTNTKTRFVDDYSEYDYFDAETAAARPSTTLTTTITDEITKPTLRDPSIRRRPLNRRQPQNQENRRQSQNHGETSINQRRTLIQEELPSNSAVEESKSQRRTAITSRKRINKTDQQTSSDRINPEFENLKNPRVINRRINDANVVHNDTIIVEEPKLNEVISPDGKPSHIIDQSIKDLRIISEIAMEAPPLAPGINLAVLQSSPPSALRNNSVRRRFGQAQGDPVVRDRRPLRRSHPRFIGNVDYS